jgi:hypothetical protein
MRASREARGKRGRQSQEGGVEGPATHYDCKSGLSTGAHKCLVKNSKSVIGISSFGERRGGRRTQATDDVVPGRTRRHLGLTGRALCLRGTSPSEWGSKEAASLPRLWRLYTIVGCWVAAKMRTRFLPGVRPHISYMGSVFLDRHLELFWSIWFSHPQRTTGPHISCMGSGFCFLVAGGRAGRRQKRTPQTGVRECLFELIRRDARALWYAIPLDLRA